jgi:Uma2 family endonuclease
MTQPVRRTATLEEWAALANQGLPVELVDGEIVEKASPSPQHGGAQAKLAEGLGPFHRKPGGPRGPGGWWILTETEIYYERTNEVFRHDLSGFLRERCPERPKEWPVRQRVDWACEILSPSNARVDVVKKQRTLHLHGVPYYWILDPEHETLMVLRHGPDGYVNLLNAGVGDVVRAEPFDAIELDLAELFGYG